LKIAIAGDWHSDLHEEPAAQALTRLGHQTVRFAWHSYFGGGLLSRAQNKYLLGPRVARLNADLIACIRDNAPDALLVYRGSHVYPETLRQIRRASQGTVLVGYNNDDPFSPAYPRWQWRHFVAAIPEYDLALAYRPHNMAEFQAAGARKVKLLRSWYVPERNRPVALTDEERKSYDCDVVFAGHYEDDGRLECLEAVVREGWNLNLFGHDYGWHPALRKSPVLRSFMPVRNVWGEDYNKALCGARVALCFLSRLNRDTYTRRSFEIPASGTLMLAQYTDDHATLFKPGEDADFFSSPQELVQKLGRYLGDEALHARVALAGHRRVAADGHDVVSRMRQVVQWIAELKEERRGA
jgi:spore maturation protein CgeB